MLKARRPRRLTPRPVSEAVEAAVDASSALRTDRLVSVKRFSELTGFDRNTVSSWIGKGCPVVSEGTRGEAYVLDVRAVWKWREAQVREEALRGSVPAGAGGEDDGTGFVPWMGIRDPAKAFAAQERFLKVAALRRDSLPRVPMEAANERAMGLIRQAVMAIPDRIARDMTGYPKGAVEAWRRQARDHCANALKAGAQAVQAALGALDE